MQEEISLLSRKIDSDRLPCKTCAKRSEHARALETAALINGMHVDDRCTRCAHQVFLPERCSDLNFCLKYAYVAPSVATMLRLHWRTGTYSRQMRGGYERLIQLIRPNVAVALKSLVFRRNNCASTRAKGHICCQGAPRI